MNTDEHGFEEEETESNGDLTTKYEAHEIGCKVRALQSAARRSRSSFNSKLKPRNFASRGTGVLAKVSKVRTFSFSIDCGLEKIKIMDRFRHLQAHSVVERRYGEFLKYRATY